MAYPDHYLLAWGGSIYGGPEQWVNTMRLVPQGWDEFGSSWVLPAFDIDGGAMDDVANDVRTHFQNPDSGYSSDVRLEWVKFNAIASTGRYKDTTTTHRKDIATPFPAGTGSCAFPAQVSMAVTFKTNRGRGLASRGRVFVPSPNKGLMPGSGRMSQGNIALVAAAWKTFITNVNNWPGYDVASSPQCAVVSNRSATGAFSKIHAVTVGDVLDTQRRRREQLVEAYCPDVIV